MQAFSIALILYSVTWTQRALAAPTDFQLLVDPGPKYICYDHVSLDDETTIQTYYGQCGDVSQGYENPSWKYSYYDVDPNVPFTPVASGGNGNPITVTLVNNAQGDDDCSNEKEPTLFYEYPGLALKKQSNGNEYNLVDYDQWIVEYDVLIHPDTTPCPNCQGCNGFNRKWLTTDFIYNWKTCDTCNESKSLISIIHYDPVVTGALRGPRDFYGYRIQVDGPPYVEEGVATHVALDFKALLLRYSSELCLGGTLPYAVNLYSLQIVSSNVNMSSTIDISNVSLNLRNNPDPTPTYPVPDWPPGSTPTYCPTSSPSSPTQANACHVQYSVTSQWSAGYTVDIELENLGSTSLSSWTLTWTFPEGQSVSGSGWNADVIQNGQAVSASSLSTNGNLGAQNTADFGFNVDASLNGEAPGIPAFSMNGVSCSVN